MSSARSAGAVAILMLTTAAIASPGDGPLPTTLDDFFQPGTQPTDGSMADLVSSQQCSVCHGNFDIEAEPYRVWAATMMAQSARDPVWQASMVIANQDATDAGEYCIRCHAPVAFASGRSVPTDGSAFQPIDFEGVNCNFCHRLVDPIYIDGVSPAQDDAILSDLDAAGLMPPQGSNARFILDPADSRRGPFDDVPANVHLGFPQPEIVVSPFHRKAELCWTCHDVSNPLTQSDGNGGYEFGPLGVEHPDHDQNNMLPVHRTYSEWLNSYYATVGIQHNGRFGGNHPTGIMKDCQDCHMPDQEAFGCGLGPPFFLRQDVPQHSFLGSNTWVLRSVRDLYDDFETGLSEETVDNAIARNIAMLEAASDLTLSQDRDLLTTRVTNQTGHKLPTGFPDGRRVWVNVKLFDAAETLIEEYGHYDFVTGDLTTSDTTVFEAVLGISAEQSLLTGLPVGPTMHFVLADEILLDNRIPPTGWDEQIAATNQTMPIGESYVEGQHWHDTEYLIPNEARSAIVTVYHQVTSKEFMDFLKDENETDGLGDLAHAQWVAQGMSPPVVMDMEEITLAPLGDITGDGCVDVDDMLTLLSYWGPCPPPQFGCPPDLDRDGTLGVGDLLIMLGNWGC